jgi:hypothetical protein
MKLIDIDIAAIISGIISLSSSSYLSYLIIPVGILAIIFGTIVIQRGDPKNYGFIGQILGIIAVSLVIVTILFFNTNIPLCINTGPKA